MKEKRHYTNQERHKIYTAPKVKLKNVPAVPKHKERSDIQNRRELIRCALKSLAKPIYCTALKSNVSVIKKGVEETVRYASISQSSTMFALNLTDILREAVYVCELEPHNQNQAPFKSMHLLICPVKRYGYAKIVIGEFYDNTKDLPKYSHYCITKISLKQIKK